MTGLIWKSSAAGVFTGLAGIPIWAVTGPAAGLGWVVGGLIAGLAFGSFLGVSRLAVLTPHTPKAAVFLIPLVCLGLVALLGVSALPLISRNIISANHFAISLMGGTLICQAALFWRVRRFQHAEK